MHKFCIERKNLFLMDRRHDIRMLQPVRVSVHMIRL